MLLLILLTLIASVVAYHEIYSHELFCYVMVSHNGGEFMPNRQVIPTVQINKWMIGMYVASACAAALLIGWLCNKTRIISIITIVFAIIGAAGLIYGYSIWDNKELLTALAFALIPSFIVLIASIVGMTRKG